MSCGMGYTFRVLAQQYVNPFYSQQYKEALPVQKKKSMPGQILRIPIQATSDSFRKKAIKQVSPLPRTATPPSRNLVLFSNLSRCNGIEDLMRILGQLRDREDMIHLEDAFMVVFDTPEKLHDLFMCLSGIKDLSCGIRWTIDARQFNLRETVRYFLSRVVTRSSIDQFDMMCAVEICSLDIQKNYKFLYEFNRQSTVEEVTSKGGSKELCSSLAQSIYEKYNHRKNEQNLESEVKSYIQKLVKKSLTDKSKLHRCYCFLSREFHLDKGKKWGSKWLNAIVLSLVVESRKENQDGLTA